MTRDDLVLDDDLATAFPAMPSHAELAAAVSQAQKGPFAVVTNSVPTPSWVVTVEEKIDGANLAIYLDEDGGSFVCQNRGHVVHDQTASQWSGLSKFLETHADELRSLFYGIDDVLAAAASALSAQPPVPPATSSAPPLWSRWVLYGEWCAARHSLWYQALPSSFIAFDLYHSGSGTFLATNQRDAAILQLCPNLAIVPRLGTLKLLPSTEVGGRRGGCAAPPAASTSWWDAVHALWYRKPSHYAVGDPKAAATSRDALAKGVCEGAMLRVESPEWGIMLRRAKLVHDEFTTGIEAAGHWTSKSMVKNGILH